MASLGPFEPRPVLAVAVSGGADSMALALLADRWARVRGGSVLALTVDHGLRRGSRAEAREAGRRLAARGIAHAVLAWRGDKPASGIQEAARAARYGLLERRCRREGILHLLVAHHCGDQAETVAMRAGRDSGPDGLAAMPAIAERRHVRVLRPLLPVPPARLRATLRAERLAWIEDPSNRDERFERVRVRRALDSTDIRRLARAARRAGVARARRERRCARLLARHAWLRPEGYGWFRRAMLVPAGVRVAAEDGGLALARLLACVGGAAYAPRRARLARLLQALAGGRASGATLGGCHIIADGDGFLVVREARGTLPMALRTGTETEWDGRFIVRTGRLECAATVTTASAGRLRHPAEGGGQLPAAATKTLPMIQDSRGGLFDAVLRSGRGVRQAGSFRHASMRFAPARPLAGAPFAPFPVV